MALEIVRKLVGGVWRTVLEDQGSGPGSTPNLAAVLAEGADAGGSAITGLDDPTADQDAATKKYVDDNGGSVTVKHTIVGIDYTDIDPVTGCADLYLLPENETLLVLSPVIVTVGFDGTNGSASPFDGTIPTGPTGDLTIGDAFAAFEVNADNLIDSLMLSTPPDNSFVLGAMPCVTPPPGGGPVQLLMDFSGGSTPLNSIGTQGHMDVSLVLLVRP